MGPTCAKQVEALASCKVFHTDWLEQRIAHHWNRDGWKDGALHLAALHPCVLDGYTSHQNERSTRLAWGPRCGCRPAPTSGRLRR